jgi:hypothetical protein
MLFIKLKIDFTETKRVEKVFFIGENQATNIEEWANEIAAELVLRL